MQPQLNPPLPDQPKPAGQGWERKAQPELAKPRRWPWLAGLFVVAAAGYFYWTWRNDKERQNLTASAGIRTFTVQGGGRLDNTILLTGQTGPEKYSSLLTPQMRGGRGQSGRGDGQNFGSRQRGGNGGSGGGGTGASSGGGGGSSSGGASGASATSAASAAVVSTSTSSSAAGGSGSSSGMSAGMRSSTSRVGGASGASRTPARSSTSAASGSMGPDGTGSSAANLPGNQGGGGAPGGGGGGMRGGGGPGGGMSEFSLVLQDAAKPGSRVKKGDVVAEFDRQYMLTRLDDFRASVAQAEASYQKLLAQVEVNKKAHDQTIANAVAAVEKAKLDMKTLAVLSSMDSERRGLALEEAEARLKQLRQEVRYVDIGLAADRRTADLEMQQARLELKRNEMNADRMIMKEIGRASCRERV